jgi:phosphoribosyl-AMP cyclohydrolase
VLNEKVTTVTRRIPKSKKTKQVTKREIVRGEIRGRVAQVAATSREWLAATGMGVYVSLDRGHSWHGGPIIGQQNFVSVSALGDEVAAATPFGVLLSQDAGTTWKPAPLPPFVTRVYRVTLEPERVWITTHEGGFYSADRGQTWRHILLGRPAMQAVSLHYDAPAERMLAVATNGEVFAARDGESWTRAAEPGWPVHGVSVAGSRLLGVTQFSGIVAPPAEAQDQRAASAAKAGNSQ